MSARLHILILLALYSFAFPSRCLCEIVEGKAIVKMKTAHTIQEAQSDLNYALFTVYRLIWAMEGVFALTYDDSLTIGEALILLRADTDVDLAEPVATFELYCDDPIEPNDPAFENQWNLFDEEGIRADVRAREAWCITTGTWNSIDGKKIVTAVLESGLQYDHPDFSRRGRLELENF